MDPDPDLNNLKEGGKEFNDKQKFTILIQKLYLFGSLFS